MSPKRKAAVVKAETDRSSHHQNDVDWSQKTVANLKAKCTESGLETNGKKQELIARLQENLGGEQAAGGVEDEVKEDVSPTKKVKHPPPSAPSESVDMMTDESGDKKMDWTKETLVKLKAKCTESGLEAKGKKRELIDRIQGAAAATNLDNEHEQTYQCPHCEVESFNLKNSLNRHIKRSHKGSMATDQHIMMVIKTTRMIRRIKELPRSRVVQVFLQNLSNMVEDTVTDWSKESVANLRSKLAELGLEIAGKKQAFINRIQDHMDTGNSGNKENEGNGESRPPAVSKPRKKKF